MNSDDAAILYSPNYREQLIASADARAFRKKARILAVQVDVAFVVETDRGPMRGRGGDWLVTNHPDDDPGSDLWTISDERMQATYEPAE